MATLKYLKKGGRLTPAVAAIGTMLRLKPVLTIQGEKLDSCAKARTMHQARQLMIDHIREDIETRFGGVEAHRVHMDIAHTNNRGRGSEIPRTRWRRHFRDIEVGFVDSAVLKRILPHRRRRAGAGYYRNYRIKVCYTRRNGEFLRVFCFDKHTAL